MRFITGIMWMGSGGNVSCERGLEGGCEELRRAVRGLEKSAVKTGTSHLVSDCEAA
jgi:hypothetical protein